MIADREHKWFTRFCSESFDSEPSETPLNLSKSPKISPRLPNLRPVSPAIGGASQKSPTSDSLDRMQDDRKTGKRGRVLEFVCAVGVVDPASSKGFSNALS